MKNNFNISRVPFSYHGSWMSIAIPPGESELFFRNHHHKSHDLFSIRLIVDGKKVTPQIAARPDRLVLTAGDTGRVEICFENPDTVRMRGQGAGIAFAAENIHAYTDGPGLAVFNFRRALRRYQFETLRGELHLTGAYAAPEEDLENLANLSADYEFAVDDDPQPEHQEIIVMPDQAGGCEVAIDEFWSTWPRPERAPFDDCLSAAEQASEAFHDSMPEAPAALAAARELAAYIDWSCTVNPCGLVKRPTLFMSKNWMNNVWSWDQCFNAMALAKGQPSLAMDQMLTLVDHQDEFGAYTDAFNDLEMHYNFSKPPVHGFAFGELLKRLPERPAPEVMETMYTSLSRQADWWLRYRCYRPDSEEQTKPGIMALPYYLHGNDSGWDNSTMFARGVPLVAPDLSALLVVQMDELAELAAELGKDAEERRWRQRAEALFERMMAELWRGDHFVARLADDGTDVESRSLIPWLTLILGRRLSEKVRADLKAGIERHLTEWGPATERLDSPDYIADGYWRGPVWAPSTFLAVAGLDRAGYGDLADTIAQRFCKLCAESGFAENYNAVTGEPLRDPAYTWTASVFLLFAERFA
ncbi:MAG: trehalase family glycosidase [Lentisphaeria bacterium]